MEYFAKFTRHIGTPKKAVASGATQLVRFEKAWKTVQSVCYYQSKWRGMQVGNTPVPAQLEVMFDLLVQEDIQQAGADDWTTGACMEYLLGNGVLDALVSLAESDTPAGVRGVILSNLSTFINLADDKLLVQKAVHNPVLDLLRWYDPASDAADDGAFVGLLYAICSKIRGDPMLLNIFFQDRKWLRSVEQRSFSSESIAAMMRSIESLRSEGGSATSGFEFLLFSHLLRFIHRDGEVGDTARTSLLFLLELATAEIMASTGSSTALENFILDDSGFAAILSAALGAMYSQLPRSLQVAGGPAAVIPESFPSYSADLQNAIESSIFTSGASPERWAEDRGPVSSSSPEFRACLASFAHLLGFIQEILYRCPSAHICTQLLVNLRNNFLQAILYPSLLESSDTDGSSVAVMRYLEAMLQVARHEDLVSTIMDFLTDESSLMSSDDQQKRQSPASTASASSSPAGPACLPFTLRDLVYTNLQSSVSIDATVSALNLLRLILSKHCRYSPRLIEVERVQPSGVANGWMTNCTVAIDIHRQELEMYARLMAQLQGDSGERRGASDGHALRIPWRKDTAIQFSERPKPDVRTLMPESFSTGYDEYLEDAALEWDSHQAYHVELDALSAAHAARDALADKQQPSPPARGAGDAIASTKKRQLRPRKYSEAVMAPAATKDSQQPHESLQPAPGARVSCDAPHACQGKHSKYSIKSSDPVVRALMNLLTKYFAQSRECNLALTGVLAALVGCPYRTLDLWLGFSVPVLLTGVLSKPWSTWMDNLRNISDDGYDEESSDSEGEGDVQERSRRRPGGAPATAIATASAEKYVGLDTELQEAIQMLPSGATPPSLYLVVSGLVQQAAALRSEIPDFARRLKRARNALMGVVEDADDLDEELERTDNPASPNSRSRDRGISSASLESARSASLASPRSKPPMAPAPQRVLTMPPAGERSRSTSTATRNQAQRDAPSAEQQSMAGSRARSSSAAHTSEIASSVSAASTSNARSGVLGEGPASPGSSWHALGVPPANANLAEFLENVIILQESLKEIIARVQVRRENGGDENAVI
ncbi:hypothetical protein GGF46_000526 [Coemansia sp. RSA 552]|nr:hypothetical protein GGF46_000526 [Coemansia sp. RSA 552]